MVVLLIINYQLLAIIIIIFDVQALLSHMSECSYAAGNHNQRLNKIQFAFKMSVSIPSEKYVVHTSLCPSQSSSLSSGA